MESTQIQIHLTHLKSMDLSNLDSRTSPFRILGALGGIFFHFILNFNSKVYKQTMKS